MSKKPRRGRTQKCRCCGAGSPEDCLEITDRRTRCVSCGNKFRRSQLDTDQFCLECAALVRCEGEDCFVGGRLRKPEELTYGLCDICLAVELGLVPRLSDVAEQIIYLDDDQDE